MEELVPSGGMLVVVLRHILCQTGQSAPPSGRATAAIRTGTTCLRDSNQAESIPKWAGSLVGTKRTAVW
jgi:hypothetical protein